MIIPTLAESNPSCTYVEINPAIIKDINYPS